MQFALRNAYSIVVIMLNFGAFSIDIFWLNFGQSSCALHLVQR